MVKQVLGFAVVFLVLFSQSVFSQHSSSHQSLSHEPLAQPIDPYNRIRDPFAIARLDEPDFARLRLNYGVGFGIRPDDSEPGYFLYAQDTGAGMLSHFFVTARTPDSLTQYKLYIDGKLFRAASLHDFYSTNEGIMRSPLDTMVGEARISQVQIPYHSGFKLIYKTDDWRTFYNYCWRPLPTTSVPSSGDIHSSQLLAQQMQAEQVYNDPSLLWLGVGGTDTNFAITLPSATRGDGLVLHTSAIVRELRLRANWYDPALDSVWIDIRWDDESTPSFSAPLMALFGQNYDFRAIHSLPYTFSQDSGLSLRFPLPFAASMRISFRNESSKSVTLEGGVTYLEKPVDRSAYGYFYCHSNQTNPTQYHVPHHVMRARGKGKYVGMLMGIHNLQRGSTYEGDPVFTVDSLPDYSFHYDGMEDYFNGAQYFSWGNFNTPFGGTSNLYAAYYRWHFLDVVDFFTSLDLDFQHGLDNDQHEHYRTLAFWYQHHLRYWTEKDSVRVDSPWRVAGASYASHESITVTLNGTTVGSTSANATGAFDLGMRIPHLKEGFYTLAVNGEAYPSPIYIHYGPSLQIVTEPQPVALQLNDTVAYSGEGYALGDSIAVWIGSVLAESHSTVDELHRVHGWAVVPQLATGAYPLTLRGIASGQVTSENTIGVTRTLTYDYEDLRDTLSSDTGTSRYHNVGWLYSYAWRHNAVCQFAPIHGADHITFRFYVPHADTFQIASMQSQGNAMGDYDLWLDGVFKASHSGYEADQYRAPDSISLGTHALTQGVHEVTFRYRGHDPRCTDSLLWADYIRLTPTTNYQNLSVESKVSVDPMAIYPEPVSNGMLTVVLPGAEMDQVLVTVTNVLGQEVLRTIAHASPAGTVIKIGDLSDGSYIVTCRDPRSSYSKLIHVVRGQ